MEGTPIQELAAIEINRSTHAFVDVFHGFAYTEESDSFARRHVHGLNVDYLKEHGFPDEKSLLDVFKLWIAQKPYVAIYANDSRKESEALNMRIFDFKLAPWNDRKTYASHQLAIRYKELCIPILTHHCTPRAHSCFVRPPPSSNLSSLAVKSRHGHHCALYDVLELYFEGIML